MGLRELKKEQTRDLLAAAAVRLFIQRGYEATTIEEIAAAVGVSPRTFFRYYPSKEDVVVGLLRSGAVDLQDELSQRPSSECLADALRAATHRWAELSAERAASLLQLTQLLTSSPVLRARLDEERHRGREVLSGIVADRMGVVCTEDNRPRLIATLALSVISDAIEQWSASGGAQPLTSYVDAGFDLLKGGLPTAPAVSATHKRAG